MKKSIDYFIFFYTVLKLKISVVPEVFVYKKTIVDVTHLIFHN